MRARILIVVLIVLIAAAVFTLKTFTKGPLAFAGAPRGVVRTRTNTANARLTSLLGVELSPN
jgi:hypothetical protein